jgi:hypothetical protein
MAELADLDSKVIESRDSLRAVRLLEFAIKKICQIKENKICFLFDEFDEAYKNFPKVIFELLRGIRDANKPYLCFALFLRTLPEKLRTSNDIESFYELFSRNLIGIGPYSKEDTLDIIRNLLERFKHDLDLKHHNDVARLSGGHPGLVLALLRILIDNPSASYKLKNIEWFANLEAIDEECRKIWRSLLDDERAGLLAVARGSFDLPRATKKIIYEKGLLDSKTNAFFSPLFELYVKGM